jgi:hypothetical protein
MQQQHEEEGSSRAQQQPRCASHVHRHRHQMITVLSLWFPNFVCEIFLFFCGKGYKLYLCPCPCVCAIACSGSVYFGQCDRTLNLWPCVRLVLQEWARVERRQEAPVVRWSVGLPAPVDAACRRAAGSGGGEESARLLFFEGRGVGVH